MRTNLPVTDQEHLLAPDTTLVSTTDLQGRITYCNSAFIAASGFTREELLGQPHNLIRHPDMPEEAFRDLWATVQSGRPWTGLVKNRRKEGSHYWVTANVTPVMERGSPVGFLSVRSVPSREQVQAADALYATMRAEAQAGPLRHRLRAGRVLRTDWPSRLREACRPGMSARLALVGASLCGLGLVAGMALAPWLSRAPGLVALGGAAVLALALLGGGWWLARMTVRPLFGLLLAANRMAAGDMSQTLHAERDDLVGQFTLALNQLNVNLKSIVSDARAEVDRMRGAAREIAAGNQDLSNRTEAQAANLQRTASSMAAISDTVRQSADTAREAAGCAQQANQVTQDGSSAVQQVSDTMQGIRDSSSRIGEIIGVIDGIAFQTNILALNAAVEAARAGEQGRGFAVVAGEVRALAQRTSTAAREVKRIVEDSTSRIEAGHQRTDAASTTMGHAMQSVQRVGGLITEISTGADQQLQGISQVSEAMASLDDITQKNAALVEQVAAAASQLEAQATAVAEAVGVFRLGAGDPTPPDAVDLRRAMKAARQAA